MQRLAFCRDPEIIPGGAYSYNPHLPTATVAFLRCPARPCSGTIDTRELTAALSGLGFEAKNATVYQVRGRAGADSRSSLLAPRATLFLRPLAPQLIAKVDKDGSGQVDFDEVRGGETTRRRRSLLLRRVVVLACRLRTTTPPTPPPAAVPRDDDGTHDRQGLARGHPQGVCAV